ncbi:MAG: hypothetical protein HYX83_00500 [Chloroflexi bacterium]|nr:hypothetical protein [Chloroflexota bacterium]
MEIQTAQEAYNDIIAHIKKEGSSFSKWYAGIASNWQTRLFNDHQVPQKESWWVACQCATILVLETSRMPY